MMSISEKCVNFWSCLRVLQRTRVRMNKREKRLLKEGWYNKDALNAQIKRVPLKSLGEDSCTCTKRMQSLEIYVKLWALRYSASQNDY